LRAAGEQGAWGYVAGLVRKDVPVVDGREPLEAARFKMSEAGVPFVAVVREGTFLGLVTELELAVVADRLSNATFQRDGAARVGQPRGTW
jgi:CBS domain-containing protein